MATNTIPINRFRRKKAVNGLLEKISNVSNNYDNIQQDEDKNNMLPNVDVIANRKKESRLDYISNNKIINGISVPKFADLPPLEYVSAPEPATFIKQDEDKDANFWKRIYSNPTLALNTLNGLTGITLAGISKANTRRKINSMSSPIGAAPIPKQYPQRLSVKPQIENIKNTVNANLRTLKNNTASSKTLSARSVAQRQYGLKNLNEVITAAANSNAELANKSNDRNTELDKLFGKWNTEFTKQKFLTDNSKLDSKITNTNKLLSNILGVGQNFATNLEKYKQYKLSEAYLKANAARYLDIYDYDEFAKLIASGKFNKQNI